DPDNVLLEPILAELHRVLRGVSAVDTTLEVARNHVELTRFDITNMSLINMLDGSSLVQQVLLGGAVELLHTARVELVVSGGEDNGERDNRFADLFQDIHRQ